YQPPQVDALASLLDAKKDVEKALQKAKDQLQDQDKETIKQAYVELLKKQKEIRVGLLKVDSAPKDANGDIPHEEQVLINRLPGDQGALIEKAAKIGEQLKTLDSVVYDWANKDIMKSMGQVKDNLAKPDTGKPTQVAEGDTETQLQNMIDSLVTKKPDDQFEKRQGGGGGGNGSGKAKLPTEAELRLLKKNQEVVDDRTKAADKQKEKDKEELLALSTRQSDLRNLLDVLVKKATGQGLGPPPDPKDELPPDVKKEDLDNKEIDDKLLNDKVDDKAVDSGIKGTGDNMGRSANRLARNDPGEVTQEIQKRIVVDIDQLIKMAQQQQQQSQSKPGSGKPGEQQGPPKPAPGQGQQQVAQGKKPNQQGKQAAQDSTLQQANNMDPDLNAQIKEAQAEWGKITARNRQAVQEGAGEEVIGKYQKLVEDYYRSLAEQAKK
ncbi:MAG TPA: hypothetical protein VFE47_10085, partial [Tepidisphaeraceae bacterium]|nr:hypothetical protein [Tepidisphaeraceae bacterium]